MPSRLGSCATGKELRIRQLGLSHRPARHAELADQFQLAPELRAGDLAGQELAILADRLFHLVGSFIDKLHPEMPHPQGQHSGYVLRSRLGARVENSVAAAGVGLDDVLSADPIAQFDLAMIARPPTICIIGAAREESTEEAMLHVKH